MKTILAVDDNKAVRGYLAFALSQAGYHVLQASDGQEAMALLNQTRVDCILADVAMPDMDGPTLIKNLRNTFAYRATPILVLAREQEKLQMQESREAGATGWLKKPFNPDKLLGTVKRVIQ